jgi:hypothetical protein
MFVGASIRRPSGVHWCLSRFSLAARLLLVRGRQRSNSLELVAEDLDIRGCLDPDPNFVAVDTNNRQDDIVA